MRPVVVIGIGNMLMSDEGIGVHLVRALAARSEAFPTVEFLDLGMSGMTILHVLAGRRKAVVLDCARMNEPPGTIRRFTPDQVVPVAEGPRLSLHEGDLLNLVAMARRLGECPESVVIYGIQPDIITGGESLSPVLAGRFEQYIQIVERELNTGICS